MASKDAHGGNVLQTQGKRASSKAERVSSRTARCRHSTLLVILRLGHKKATQLPPGSLLGHVCMELSHRAVRSLRPYEEEPTSLVLRLTKLPASSYASLPALLKAAPPALSSAIQLMSVEQMSLSCRAQSKWQSRKQNI